MNRYLSHGNSFFIARVSDVVLVVLFFLPVASYAQSPGKQTAVDFFNAGLRWQMDGNYQKALDSYHSALALDPKLFGALANSGIIYLVQKKFDDAIGSLKLAAAVIPNNAIIHFYLGISYEASGHSTPGTEELKEAVRLDPDFLLAQRALATAYGNERHYDDAIRLLAQSSELHKSNAALLADLGHWCLAAGWLSEAVENFSKLVALKPQYPLGFVGLGIAYERMGRLEDAASSLSEAVKLNPASMIAHFDLGLIFQKLGRHPDAISEFLTAINLSPNYVESYQQLTDSYLSIGRLEDAAITIEKAAALDSNNVVTIHAMANIYLQQNRYEDALVPLAKLVAIRPRDPETHFLLGNTFMMAGQYDKAIKTLEETLELKPDHKLAQERLQVSIARKHFLPELENLKQAAERNPLSVQARGDYGVALNHLSRFADSERELLAAINLDAESAELYNYLGINYGEWGKSEKAIAAYEHSAKLKPHHVLYYSIGNEYSRLGRNEQAVAAYKKALEIKPTFVQALYQLGVVYRNLGRYPEAIETFQQLLQVDPTDVYGNHALGLVYLASGNRDGAMLQYQILKGLNKNLADDLLRAINR